jgi:hypothetical protein
MKQPLLLGVGQQCNHSTEKRAAHHSDDVRRFFMRNHIFDDRSLRRFSSMFA